MDAEMPGDRQRAKMHAFPSLVVPGFNTAGSLPFPRTLLIGRQRDVAAVCSMLRSDNVSLITLTGSGGIGKTRLALQIAAEIAPEFADSVCFVDLSVLHDHDLVLPAIATALGLGDPGGRTVAEQLISHLRSRQTLLVLDNLEQVIEAAPQIANLLTHCPLLKVLVTSRVVLRLSLEHDVPVDPLPVSEAIQLFTDRARAAVPGFVLSDENGAAVEAICRRLDGLPLAIELAAARVSVVPPIVLLARLDKALPLLTGGGRDLPPRQRTLRDTIAWSYDLLSLEDQKLFRHLAVFDGGCSLNAVEAMMEASDGQVIDAFEGISSLIYASLLRQGVGPDEKPRYLLLETVREFGLEQLSTNGEEKTARRTHATYFATVEQQAISAYGTSSEVTWLHWFQAEKSNLRSALEWAVEQQEPGIHLQLVSALWWFKWAPASRPEGLVWMDRAVTATVDAPPALGGMRSRLLVAAARGAYRRGDDDRAEALLEEGRVLALETRDDRALALLALDRMYLAITRIDLDEGDLQGNKALTVWRALDEPGWAVETLYLLGWIESVRGNPAQTEALMTEALDLIRTNGAVLAEAKVLEGVCSCAHEQGDYVRAADMCAEALVLARDRGNPATIANCFESLGIVASSAGQHEQATRLIGAAEAIWAHPEYGKILPFERADRERKLAPIRAQLPAATFHAQRTLGREMPLERAINEALALAQSVIAMDPASPDAPTGLTKREIEVLRILARGATDREIAETLFISRRTVNAHVASILGKLGAPTRQNAVARARELALLPADGDASRYT